MRGKLRMRKLKKCEIIILSVIIGMVIILALVNVFCINNDQFFEISMSTCISIIVVLLVSYWLTNNSQDERNQKEIYLRILEKVVVLVNDPIMFKVDEKTDIFLILMKKRELNNTVTLLKEYSRKFNVEKELISIDEKVQEYADLIGNHQDDLRFLSMCEKDLRRPLELIENKVYEAMMKVFE